LKHESHLEYSRNRNKCPVFIVTKVFPHGPFMWRSVACTV
jgi:hypothetical protein